MTKKPKTTVICAVWHKDPNRLNLLEKHFENLKAQTVPVECIYVFDNDDVPPKELAEVSVVVGRPLTIYEAWNVALSLVQTPYVANLNLDDRFRTNAIEVLEASLEALSGDFIGGDWKVCFDQQSVNTPETCSSTADLKFDPAWPPQPETPVRLGSGTGERGTYGPAVMWRMNCHIHFPRYPYRMSDGYLIKSAGDSFWWDLLIRAGRKTPLRVNAIIGNYLSSPSTQAEFRAGDEFLRLQGQSLSLL